MPAIRLIADDLSGALDAVAPFSRSYGTIPVYFSLPTDITGKQCAALSLETRDGTKENSVRQSALAGRFYNGANICYQKIDSLLRGYPAHEIDTLFRLGNFQVALLAPAFPAQKRVTIGGIQRFTSGEPVPHERTNPLQDQLRSLGHDVTTIRHASQLTHVEHGIAVCDAEDDDTLVEIVEAGRLLQPPVLWIGTSGLAHALAEDTSNVNKVNETYGWGDQPILAIIGTNHPVMCEQVKTLSDHQVGRFISIATNTPSSQVTYEIELALSSAKAVIITFDFPDLPGAMVTAQIEKRLVAILPAIPRPGCLFVSGGKTLATVCKAVKSEVIEVIEELLPGVPISRMGGEQWNNVLVISKSGAFGQPTTLLDIIQNFKEVRYA